MNGKTDDENIEEESCAINDSIPKAPEASVEQKSGKKESKAEKPAQKVPVDEKAELNEKMLRLAAEFDNYKKRTQKDLIESGAMGKAAFIKEMLPVIDEFELALMALDKSEDKTMAKGIRMLYSNFMDVLKRNGLSEIKCEGTFDPYKHEIIMVRESKEKEGTILDVIKKGYEFSGRLLRPASVIVAKAQANEEKNNDTNR